MNNELLSVRLLKSWGGNAPGTAVLVDRKRAVRMEEDGLGSIEPPATMSDENAAKAPAGPPADKMVKMPPKRKGGEDQE